MKVYWHKQLGLMNSIEVNITIKTLIDYSFFVTEMSGGGDMAKLWKSWGLMFGLWWNFLGQRKISIWWHIISLLERKFGNYSIPNTTILSWRTCHFYLRLKFILLERVTPSLLLVKDTLEQQLVMLLSGSHMLETNIPTRPFSSGLVVRAWRILMTMLTMNSQSQNVL